MINRKLFDYYKSMEVLVSVHGWDANYIDKLFPYEKDLYMGLIINRKAQIQAAAEQARQQLT